MGVEYREPRYSDDWMQLEERTLRISGTRVNEFRDYVQDLVENHSDSVHI